MIPTEGTAQVLALTDLAQVQATLLHSRVSAPGIEIMSKKALHRVVRVRGLDVRAASILKQEMLSRGGEVATSREVYELHGEKADCVIMGTLVQFERLLPKLGAQPFGLRRLAVSIETALHNYDARIPQCPSGLDLTTAPVLMGVLNVTPDSFSDGDLYADVEAAAQAGLDMIRDGAGFVDVGGESTQPGAEAVHVEQELARVLPLVKALAPSLPGRVSIDTYKARVAAEALAAGAYMVNDVSALRHDPEMIAVVRDARCPVVLMHMLGEPKTMQKLPEYGDVIEELYAFFVERLNWAVDHGLSEENLLIDPGIGFGKTIAHNLTILRSLAAFRSLGRPIVVGTSRKRFLGDIAGIEAPKDRDGATAATTALMAAAGAHIVRVHRVGPNLVAARVGRAISGSGPS